MLRGASVHASPGGRQQSRHYYLQLGDRLQLTAWPDFFLLIYGRGYAKVLATPKNKIVILVCVIFSSVDPPYFLG